MCIYADHKDEIDCGTITEDTRDASILFGAYYRWMIYGINCCKNYTAYILFVLLGTCS